MEGPLVQLSHVASGCGRGCTLVVALGGEKHPERRPSDCEGKRGCWLGKGLEHVPNIVMNH